MVSSDSFLFFSLPISQHLLQVELGHPEAGAGLSFTTQDILFPDPHLQAPSPPLLITLLCPTSGMGALICVCLCVGFFFFFFGNLL